MRPQHIVGFHASNIKRIRAVRIELDKKTGSVILTGANSAGKSSVLDAIAMALRGKNAVPQKPLRSGKAKAYVVLETEDLVVTRRFTEIDSYLEVCNREGAKYGRGQEMLDKLVAVVGFDPLAFSLKDSKAQAKELLSICPTALDLDDNANRALGAEERRRDLNRDLKRLQAQLDGMPRPADGTPEEGVSVADLMNESSRLLKMQVSRDRCVAQITASAAELAEIEKRADWLRATIEKMTRLLSDSPDVSVRIAEIESQLKTAEVTNAAVRAASVRKATAATVAVARRAAAEAEIAVQRIRDERTAALTTAKFPVPGLTIGDDGGVIFNGIPLEQASTSEKIRIGVALACSANPTLRVIFIRDASLLDKASMSQLEGLAQDNDLQIWMERVEDSSPAAIQIVDGSNIPESEVEAVEAGTAAGGGE